MVLQAARHHEVPGIDGVRVGFTVTKKVGNAVVRNRIKRRLRAVAQEIIPEYAENGWDLVLIGRNATKDRKYEDLRQDLYNSLGKVGARADEHRGTK